MGRRRNSTADDLVYIISSLIFLAIFVMFKIIYFTFFIITYYRSGYKEKSSLSWFRVYFSKGNYGEYKLYRKLIKQFGKENIFVNIYLDNEKTMFTEIDLLAIDNKHIYVFEMKNYKGWIYGDETQKYWTQTFNRRTKNRFYSPIEQNIGHIKALNNLLQLDDNIFESIIVFSDKSRIKLEVPYNVIKLKYVKQHFDIYCDDENIMNEQQIEKIKQLLSTKVNVDPRIKKQHIKEIESFKKN